MSRMQEKITNSPDKVYAGIDVGKERLDLFIYPYGLTRTVDNTPTGIKTLVDFCLDHKVTLIALEATGKYHRRAHETLHEAGLAVAVVNPFRSRQFADSMGKLAKTDGIDASVLARFAQRMEPQATIPPKADSKALSELQTARRQVVDEISDLKRRLQSAEHDLAAEQIAARIALAEGHKVVLEQEIQKLISADKEMKAKCDILTSIPGIGKTTAALLISDLDELGRVNARQISALAGVAPMNWDSGTKHGNRMIRGGRRRVRNALYMCAVTCSRRSDTFGRTYQNLIKRGKNPKVALTAVMRKLVIIANTLITEDRHWQAHKPGL